MKNDIEILYSRTALFNDLNRNKIEDWNSDFDRLKESIAKINFCNLDENVSHLLLEVRVLKSKNNFGFDIPKNKKKNWFICKARS